MTPSIRTLAQGTTVLLLSLAAIIPAMGEGRPSKASPQRPNILLILSDDHSAPHLGCYGDAHSITPNFDTFAAEGLRFDRAYTTAPQCMPSRASILTGRSPIDIDMSRFSAALQPQFTTAPDLLKQAGYFVGVGGRDFHLDGWVKRAPEHLNAIYEKYGLSKFSGRMDHVQVDNANKRTPAREIFEAFLDKNEEGKPFFYWFNFFDPHRPWRPSHRPVAPADIELPPDLPDYPSVREDLANFYGEISDIDTKFGVLMSILEERGLKENTLVLFIGDNGEAWFRGKGTLYTRGTHVPMLMRWPGHIQPGSTTSELISGEDLTPTLLEAAGLAPTPEMTGRSFYPLLVGKPYQARDAVFAQRGAHGSSLPRSTIEFDLGRSVTTKRYHLIYNVTWQLPYKSVDIEGYDREVWRDLRKRSDEGTLEEPYNTLLFAPHRPMFELYDLERDPYQLNNLSGKEEYAKIERDLKERLDEQIILQGDFVPYATSR